MNSMKRAVFNTNFFGAIDVMKAVLPQMTERKKGHDSKCNFNCWLYGFAF